MNIFSFLLDPSFLFNSAAAYLNQTNKGKELGEKDHAIISPLVQKINDNTEGLGTLEGDKPIWQAMIEIIETPSNVREKDCYLTALAAWVITGSDPAVEEGESIVTVRRCALASLFCIKLICMIDNVDVRKRLWQAVALRLSIMKVMEPRVFICFCQELPKLFQFLEIDQKEKFIHLNEKRDYQEKCDFSGIGKEWEGLNISVETLDKMLREDYPDIKCNIAILKESCNLLLVDFPKKLLALDAKANNVVFTILLCMRSEKCVLRKLPKPVLRLIFADVLLQSEYCTNNRVCYVANKLNALISGANEKPKEKQGFSLFKFLSF